MNMHATRNDLEVILLRILGKYILPQNLDEAIARIINLIDGMESVIVETPTGIMRAVKITIPIGEHIELSKEVQQETTPQQEGRHRADS